MGFSRYPDLSFLLTSALCTTLWLSIASGTRAQSGQANDRPDVPCAVRDAAKTWRAPVVTRVDGKKQTLHELSDQLARTPIIYIAEQHDRLDHHLNQLEIMCMLNRHNKRLALAVEFFHRRFQSKVDAYLQQHGDLDRLLVDTEYFDRWGYDPRHYAPLLEYALKNSLPIVALNADKELVSAVAKTGLQALNTQQRARLPNPMPMPSPAYTQRLSKAFQAHSTGSSNTLSLDFFAQAQSLWDQTMAASIAEFNHKHPGYQIVVVAGIGHVGYEDSVPGRVRALTGLTDAVLIHADGADQGLDYAYRLQSETLELAAPGKLEVTVLGVGGQLKVHGVTEAGAAAEAGIRVGDVLVSLQGHPLTDFGSLKALMWRRMPGETVHLVVRRADQSIERIRLRLR